MIVANCPYCTKDHEIEVEDVFWIVCSVCHHLLNFKSHRLIDYGETARVPDHLPMRFKLGSTGEVRGRWFEMIGHMHFGYAEDPDSYYWDEWHVRFKDNSMGLILVEGDDLYFYAKRSKITRSLPAISEIEVGQMLEIEGYQAEVIERQVSFVKAFEGQLPDHSLPGVSLDYFDAVFRNYIISVESHGGYLKLHFGIQLKESEIILD